MVFACPGAMFCAAVSVFGVFFCSRAGHVVFSLFGKVSDDTLGGFLALLCGFSALHGHGVSLSGAVFWAVVSGFWRLLQSCWPRRFYLFWKGFRPHVRQFFGASLWLFRSSLAWCFPVRVLCFGLPCLVFGCFAAMLDTYRFGSFSMPLCGFSIFHWHGVSLSGSRVLGCRV